jgi:hypothetical protein
MDKPLDRELAAIKREEEALARGRQADAGIIPVKLGFAPDLPKELDEAVQRLWDAGSSEANNGKTDPVLRKLWSMVNKGTACLSKSEFIEFSKLKPKQMKAIGRGLVEGQTLEQARAF